jgi:bifunctional non-homologous end joining protein LigD
MDADRRAWRPQAFGHRHVRNLSDPVIEPAWDGVRVLAHVDVAAARVAIHDESGDDLTVDHAAIADALLAALAAESAIVDGYLTDQATRAVDDRAIVSSEMPSFSEHTRQLFLGGRGSALIGGRGRPGRTDLGRANREPERGEGATIAFVAVDLVALDGEPLTEIPLLERKRLLESVLAEGDLVRRTPYVRQPAGSFILTWRSFGFGGLAYKAANSRYLPGDANDEWCMAPMPRR